MTKRELSDLKYEIATELGLIDKIEEQGWKGLTSRESGKIGGLIAKKTKELKKAEEAKKAEEQQ